MVGGKERVKGLMLYVGCYVGFVIGEDDFDVFGFVWLC